MITSFHGLCQRLLQLGGEVVGNERAEPSSAQHPSPHPLCCLGRGEAGAPSADLEQALHGKEQVKAAMGECAVVFMNGGEKHVRAAVAQRAGQQPDPCSLLWHRISHGAFQEAGRRAPRRGP